MDMSILRDRISMIAALGAGVVMGISGIYLYYKANRCVTRELSHLTGTIENLRREIEELKTASQSVRDVKERRSPERRKNTSSSSANRHVSGYTSSIEDPDEEYYDFTDTEEVVDVWSSVNGGFEAGDANSSNWLNCVDNMLDLDSHNKENVYYMLLNKKDANLNNVEFLWRLAKATHLCGIVAQNRNEPERKRELVFEASTYAKMALELDNQHPEVHKWYAITIGSLGDYVSAQERIANGYTFKEHVDKALALKPEDPSLHYMLGRWCYEVASLSWIERKVAATLFSSPPDATLEESRVHLQQADKLKPDWKENLLYMAKTYIADGEYSTAISVIDKALALPVNREDDEIAHSELELLQYKYQTYRAE